MRTLVIYDSLYGNTEKIARANVTGLAGEVKLLRVGEVNPSELKTYDLLVIGSPTQGGRPTQPVLNLLEQITATDLGSTKFAAFDTRFSKKWVKIFGFATGKIADSLGKRGLTLIAPAQGFYVKGTKGDLENGEIERATSWAKDILKGISR